MELTCCSPLGAAGARLHCFPLDGVAASLLQACTAPTVTVTQPAAVTVCSSIGSIRATFNVTSSAAAVVTRNSVAGLNCSIDRSARKWIAPEHKQLVPCFVPCHTWGCAWVGLCLLLLMQSVRRPPCLQGTATTCVVVTLAAMLREALWLLIERTTRIFCSIVCWHALLIWHALYWADCLLHISHT